MHVHPEDDATHLLLNHLSQVAEDSMKSKWEEVLSFMNTCFDRAERKEINWRSKEEIKDERIKSSWIAGAQSPVEPRPCHDFNSESGCEKPDGHMKNGMKYCHRCVVCWYGSGLHECTHPLRLCNRKHKLNTGKYDTNVNSANHPHGAYKHSQYKKHDAKFNRDSQSNDQTKPKKLVSCLKRGYGAYPPVNPHLTVLITWIKHCCC